MPSVRVTGQEQLGKLARQLEEKGNSVAIKRRMSKAFKGEAKPITDAQRRSLAEGLPKRGGAAETIAPETRMSVRTSTAAATVTITDSWKGHSIKAIDLGTLRHPLFGDRSHWYDTSITPLLLTRPFMDRKIPVQLALLREMDALAEEIARGV